MGKKSALESAHSRVNTKCSDQLGSLTNFTGSQEHNKVAMQDRALC